MSDGSSSHKSFSLMTSGNAARLKEKHDGMLTHASPHSLSLRT